MRVRDMILAGLFAALTCVLSVVMIPVPFTPVPITLQVLAAVVSGAILGARLGFYSQITYLLLGVVGLPVYAGMKSGPGVLLGPTGGYIFGFVAAAWVVGYLVETIGPKTSKAGAKYGVILGAMLVGLAVIYTVGAVQLMLVAKLNLGQAMAGGVLPFIGADSIKIGAGSVVAFFAREALMKAYLLPQAKKAVL